MVITRETLNLLKLGIDRIEKIQVKGKKAYWPKVAPAMTNIDSYFRDKLITGFKEFFMHTPGQSVRSISKESLADTEYPFYVFAAAVDVDMLAEVDDVYGEIAKLPMDAMTAELRTMNKQVTNLLRNGFDTAFPIWDGQPLFSASHTSASGVAVRSNLAAPVLALNSFNLEKGLMKLWDTLDPNGEPLEFEGGADLFVNNLNFPTAGRIIESDKIAQTADNDPNIINGTLARAVRLPHLSQTSTNWFLRARDEAEHGLRTIISFRNKVFTIGPDRQMQKAIVICSRYRPVARYFEGTWGSGS